MAKTRRIFIERLGHDIPYRRPSGPLWQPAADIYRCPEGWKIKFDLAGVRPEDVQVLISDDKLVVRGVRRDSLIVEGWSYHQLEITYSRFERVISIPCDLSKAEIRSETQNGWFMLHIDCVG
jgi:HSP20 family protein